MITRIASGGLKAVVWGLAATGFAALSRCRAVGHRNRRSPGAPVPDLQSRQPDHDHVGRACAGPPLDASELTDG